MTVSLSPQLLFITAPTQLERGYRRLYMVIGPLDRNLANPAPNQENEARLQASERMHHAVYQPQSETRPQRAGSNEAHVSEVKFSALPGYDSLHGNHGAYKNPQDVSETMQGKQLWRDKRYEVVSKNGTVGCAASESVVLQHSGYKYADQAGVAKLYDQLKTHGWQEVPESQRQPGDVMFASKAGKNWGAGGNAHVGTVGSDGEIWNNSARQGETWQKEPKEVAFGEYDRFKVLRPPKH